MAITRTQFIEKYIDLIDANNFYELYTKAWDELTYTSAIGKLTQMLLAAGIDPLQHMDSIPLSYYDTYEGPTPPAIPQHIQSIKASAFFDSNIKQIVVPGSVVRIQSGAFDYAIELESITFEEGVTSIPTQCFIDCPVLEVVVLPGTLKHIEHHAFSRCPKLVEITYSGNINDWQNVDLSDNAFTESNITQVRCKDGVIDL